MAIPLDATDRRSSLLSRLVESDGRRIGVSLVASLHLHVILVAALALIPSSPRANRSTPDWQAADGVVEQNVLWLPRPRAQPRPKPRPKPKRVQPAKPKPPAKPPKAAEPEPVKQDPARFEVRSAAPKEPTRAALPRIPAPAVEAAAAPIPQLPQQTPPLRFRAKEVALSTPRRKALSAPAAPVVEAADPVVGASAAELVAGLTRQTLRYWAPRGRPEGQPRRQAIDAVPGPNLAPSKTSASNMTFTQDLEGLGLVGSFGAVPPPPPAAGGILDDNAAAAASNSFGGGTSLFGTVTGEQLLGLSRGLDVGGFGAGGLGAESVGAESVGAGVAGTGAPGGSGIDAEGGRGFGDGGGAGSGFGAGGSAAAGVAAAASPPPIAPREPFDNPKDGLRYVWIPPGAFQMGCVPRDGNCSDAEKPRHQVNIGHGFWMSRTEVTVRAFFDYANATGLSVTSAPKFNKNWKHRDHPMVKASWQDAAEFCSWTGGRLPTEAEWEYSARGGADGRVYPNGDDAGRDDANFAGKDARDKWEYTSPVGYFPANAFDLFDMAGNVWEWTANEYRPYAYQTQGDYAAEDGAAAKDGAEGGAETEGAAVQVRVMRGGSMYSNASSLRVSYRGRGNPENRLFYIGFRCVRDALP